MQSVSTLPMSTTQADEVLLYAETFVLKNAVSERQRSVLQTALDGLREQIQTWNPSSEEKERLALPPFIYVPLSVFAAIRGEDESAVPLAAAASLLFLGIDIFDDVADGDCAARWPGQSAAEMNLCAATLLCSLPQQIINGLDAPPTVIVRMQQTLAEGFVTDERRAAGRSGSNGKQSVEC